MRRFDGLKFNRTTVTLDETDFTNCEITDCEIAYSGGRFGWTNTKMTNCQIALRGPAALTASFLSSFGLIDATQPRWSAVVLELPPAQEAIN